MAGWELEGRVTLCRGGGGAAGRLPLLSALEVPGPTLSLCTGFQPHHRNLHTGIYFRVDTRGPATCALESRVFALPIGRLILSLVTICHLNFLRRMLDGLFFVHIFL
jgi:hypothetical protein